ncbi:MAG: hypothetical protein NZ805_06730 [Armatimonadetes bacterium]|nr:hypothetical protein [Armatimonadota bacterium]MDW8026780.1 hypothetical protein [Armatimonadota bacterium]
MGSHGDCDFPNSLYFHAVGFVAIEVTEVRWQGSASGGKYVKGNIRQIYTDWRCWRRKQFYW